MVYVDPENVGVYIDQKKWNKVKSHLSWIKEQIMQMKDITNLNLPADHGINHKKLERRRGFLVYVSRTYPAMTPYLKGIHHTLDSWRPHRSNDDWKMIMAEIEAVIDVQDEMDYVYPKNAPKYVFPSPRLENDLNCLLSLFEGDYPKMRHVRTRLISIAYYGFGDASGDSFGSSIENSQGLRVRYGIWGRDLNKISSNYRELCNLVETIEEEVKCGSLIGSELFIFTDNAVAEGCFYKGTAQSKHLFNLILRLRKAELEGGLRLHVVHISGKRMIAQGTDGLSRGNFMEGVMAGKKMIDFVPLNKSAFERSEHLLTWFKTWLPEGSTLLTPKDWYLLGHGVCGGSQNNENAWIPKYDRSCKIWAPAPAAAYEAMAEPVRARHMDPYVGRVFVCPRLMTNLWRKQLMKTADVVFYVLAGNRFYWKANIFEPPMIALILPFRTEPPWQLRQSFEILALETQLRELWQDDQRDERTILRKFWF